jgi:hypothetical protein
MNAWLDQLAGGDRRSIGAADSVVAGVLCDPEGLGELLRGLDFPDPVIRMRCADVLEKVSRIRPAFLGDHAAVLLNLADRAEQKETRWHFAQILPRLPLSESQAARVVALMRGWLSDASRIVQVNALQALHDLSRDAPERIPDFPALLAQAMETGPPSLRARARKLVSSSPDPACAP